MFYIVGLGNPGSQYRNTRHNVGFMVVDRLAERQSVQFRRQNGPLETAYMEYRHIPTTLIKPLTYMNRSGIAVRYLRSHQLTDDLSHLLVISDDINIPFGTLRLRKSGSSGGQKGMESIIEVLNSREFPRLRIGIGDHFREAADYVLSPFTRREQKDVSFIIETAADAVESFLEEGLEVAMNKFNRNLLEN